MTVTSRLCTSTALVCGLALAMYTAAVARSRAGAEEPSGGAPIRDRVGTQTP